MWKLLFRLASRLKFEIFFLKATVLTQMIFLKFNFHHPRAEDANVRMSKLDKLAFQYK